MIELVMLQSGIIFADISSQDASFILNCVYSVIFCLVVTCSFFISFSFSYVLHVRC